MNRKLSSKRQRILDTVNQSDCPITAKDIFEIHHEAINLATIYRALNQLEKSRLIEAFTMVCSKEGIVRFYHRKTEPHVHFFHCEKCHRFIPMDSCPLASLQPSMEQSEEYTVNTHTLYFTGICRTCNQETLSEHNLHTP